MQCGTPICVVGVVGRAALLVCGILLVCGHRVGCGQLVGCGELVDCGQFVGHGKLVGTGELVRGGHLVRRVVERSSSSGSEEHVVVGRGLSELHLLLG